MKSKFLELTVGMKDKITEFLKFSMSSLASTIVDLGLFSLLVFLLRGFEPEFYIFISTILARIASIVVNYNINAHLVFNSDASNERDFSFVKYISLAIFEIFVSAMLVFLLITNVDLNETFSKILVDSSLFFVGYLIQRTFIF